jgi:hypothetical protein
VRRARASNRLQIRCNTLDSNTYAAITVNAAAAQSRAGTRRKVWALSHSMGISVQKTRMLRRT